MTILFVGNTASDFFSDANPASVYSTTDTNHRDTALAPNDLAVFSPDGGSNPITITLGAEYTDLWVHCRVRFAGVLFGAVSGDWLKVYDATDDLIAIVDFQSDDLRAQANGDTLVTGAQIDNWPNDNMTMDVHIEVNGVTSITISVYKDGSLVSTATAANAAGKGGGARIVFPHFDMSQNNSTYKYSEFIVTNGESTLGWRLGCLEPNGVGFHTAFEGNFVELGDDDLATAAATGTALDKVSSTVTYGGPATSGGVRAIIGKAIATKGDTGPGTLKQFLRIGATDYEGAAAALTLDNTAYVEEWSLNPATGLPWATADLAGIQIGLKAEV